MFQRPFLLDASALINIYRSSNLARLNLLVENTVVQWTSGVGEEVRRREDDLRKWIERNHGETELTDREAVRFGQLILRYGVPFQHQGRTRKPLSSEDAEALAVAIDRGWVLVTDDSSMLVVADIFNTECKSSNDFLGGLVQFGR